MLKIHVKGECSVSWLGGILLLGLYDPFCAKLAGNIRSHRVQGLQLAAKLLNCFASAVVEFSIAPPPFVTHVSDRPIASAYARLRSLESGRVVNMRLETMNLAERSRELLRLLDGRHDRAAIVEAIRSWGPDAIPGAKSPEDAADLALEALGKTGLLVG